MLGMSHHNFDVPAIFTFKTRDTLGFYTDCSGQSLSVIFFYITAASGCNLKTLSSYSIPGQAVKGKILNIR